jgi:hypothetical protein
LDGLEESVKKATDVRNSWGQISKTEEIPSYISRLDRKQKETSLPRSLDFSKTKNMVDFLGYRET